MQTDRKTQKYSHINTNKSLIGLELEVGNEYTHSKETNSEY